MLSATTVAIATEFTYLRKKRRLHTGMLDDSDETLVHDLSEAVQQGLDHISHAARELGHSFADARRELVRFGLDPTASGGHDVAGMYYDEEEDARQLRRPSGPLFDEQWEK